MKKHYEEIVYMTLIHFKTGKDIVGHFNMTLGDELEEDKVIRLYDVKEGGMIVFRTSDVEFISQIKLEEVESFKK